MKTNETLVHRNLADWPTMTDRQATDMLVCGQSPWSGGNPQGVWCWDADADQVLVGTCPADAEILTYAEAIARFAGAKR